MSGNKGEVVPRTIGQGVAFVNLKVGPEPDFLIHFKRTTPGINLGWTTSPNWRADFLDTVQRAAVQIAIQDIRSAY